MKLDWKCANPVHHAPKPLVPVEHHVLPQSWGGTDGPKVMICATCHDNVHDLINAYVHAGGVPADDRLRHYSRMVQAWAGYAWNHRPSDKPPYTVVHTQSG